MKVNLKDQSRAIVALLFVMMIGGIFAGITYMMDSNLDFPDSDYDGLNDYAEFFVYETTVKDRDTDEDGIFDGDEIILEFDPRLSDSNGDGVMDGDEVICQKISEANYEETILNDNIAIPYITVNAKGNVNDRVNVKEFPDYLVGEERVLVGKAIQIEDSRMESGKITFTISEEYIFGSYPLYDIDTTGLLICYYDGKDTTPLETDVDTVNRTVTADISADGYYYIMDVPVFMNLIGVDMSTEDSEYVERKVL